VPWVVIGGLAASLLGRPRATRDIDLLVLAEESRWASLLEAGSTFGFRPRIDDPIAFARQSHVLIVRHEPTSVDVDLIIGALPFERETVAQARRITISGVQISLPTVERLLVMKAIARRPRDIADIESLLDANPRMNRRFVRRWVKAFAAALDAPDIAEDLEALFRRRRR
jgi:hypothetical protein